jgi:hypothetical protein
VTLSRVKDELKSGFTIVDNIIYASEIFSGFGGVDGNQLRFPWMDVDSKWSGRSAVWNVGLHDTTEFAMGELESG